MYHSPTLKRCEFATCGAYVIVSRMAEHWIIAGHHRNPNAQATSGRFPLDGRRVGRPVGLIIADVLRLAR